MTNKNNVIEIVWPSDMSVKERNEMRNFQILFECAARDFERDQTVIYPSEADRLRNFYTEQKRWVNVWSQPGRCMYEGCTENSIPRSHSIPMSASLQLIAEDGHVVTPRLGENGLDMKRIGIRDASTFPGFCERHEAIFAEFETKKKMSSERHYLLQTYRTLCREIFRTRRYKKRFESRLNAYRELRREFFINRIWKAPHSKPIDKFDITFESDEIERLGAETIDSLSESLPILRDLYRDLFDDIQNYTNESALIVGVFDKHLPVCLSGLGVLNYMQGDTRKRALCILAIIPEEQKTHIILGSSKEHMKVLESYFNDESSPSVLAKMESWLCHGSDHWFMTPSAWYAIPESRKKVILEQILDPNPSIAHPVEFSILDSARTLIVDFIEQELSRGNFPTSQLPEITKLLASEKLKLYDFTSN